MRAWHEVSVADWRWRALLGSILLAAAGYLAAALWSGGAAVAGAVARVGAGGLGVALSLSLLNYGLRFVRWRLYLRALGHAPDWLAHGRAYLAGFALTTTPGKAGEAVRAVLLRRWAVPYTDTLAAMFSERLSDLFGVLLLAAATATSRACCAMATACCARRGAAMRGACCWRPPC